MKDFLIRFIKVYRSHKSFRFLVNTGMVVIALAIGLTIGVCINASPDEDESKTKIAQEATRYAEDQDYSEITESDSIAIPGYDSFTFQAGSTTQEITLHNPQENTCYFEMSLILEDGTIIWTSDLLEPGMAFTEIELNEPLDAGTYSNVTLRYNCYSLKDQSQLNGAEIKVTIIAE